MGVSCLVRTNMSQNNCINALAKHLSNLTPYKRRGLNIRPLLDTTFLEGKVLHIDYEILLDRDIGKDYTLHVCLFKFMPSPVRKPPKYFKGFLPNVFE